MDVPAIGIDLGTTYCCVSFFYKGKVHIIPDEESGQHTTPSYVLINSDGEELFGQYAKRQAFRNPENTIYDVKRMIGRTIDDPELQNDITFWPFEVQEEDGLPMINVDGELYYPEQISSKILAKLKSTAERYLDLPPGSVNKSVITVPAYFNDEQRQATVDAGELAGLEVLTILNEPTAAALAFAKVNDDMESKKILVFDLGGGTFDIAVLDIHPNNIEVLGVNGDTHLGGEDFDRKLMEYCATVFKEETGIDILKESNSPDKSKRYSAQRRLKRLETYCERAKIELCSGRKVAISVDALAEGQDLLIYVTREQFEDMNQEHFQKTIDLVDATLEELGLTQNDIDRVVMVGGSTRIPKIQKLLGENFQGSIIDISMNPDLAVAYGAAIQAAMITGEESLGELKFAKIHDVTPMTVWMQHSPNKSGLSIPKNSKIPTRKTAEYNTDADNQTVAEFKVFQGNNIDLITDNMLLGVIYLDEIPENEAGKEYVDITLEVDTMGIIHVDAVIRSSGSSNSFSFVTKKRRMNDGTKRRLLAGMHRNDSFEDVDVLPRKRPVLHMEKEHDPKQSASNLNDSHMSETSEFLDSHIISSLNSQKDDPGISSFEILNSIVSKASKLNDNQFNSLLQKCEDHGLDFHFIDELGHTMLHDAVTNNHQRVIHFLVKKMANLSPKNVWQETPLHLASNVKNTDSSLKVIQYLIDHGADVCAKDSKNRTFLHTFVAHSDHSPVHFDMLVKYLHVKSHLDLFKIPGGSYETTPFQLEVARQEISSESLSLLYTNGVNFNAPDKHGDSPLFYAISRQRSLEFISALVDKFDVDCTSLNSMKNNLLHIAAMEGTMETLKFLSGLESLKKSINDQDMKGNTPLHYALHGFDSEDISLKKCRLLVSNGADVNFANNLGETPLHLVAQWVDPMTSLKAIEFLIGNGADVFLKDNNSATFLHTLLSRQPEPSASLFHDISRYLDVKNHLSLLQTPAI